MAAEILAAARKAKTAAQMKMRTLVEKISNTDTAERLEALRPAVNAEAIALSEESPNIDIVLAEETPS